MQFRSFKDMLPLYICSLTLSCPMRLCEDGDDDMGNLDGFVLVLLS